MLNTVFWLGKAASGCASYSGPTLNVKEFEGLLAQMKVVSEHMEEWEIATWRRCEGEESVGFLFLSGYTGDAHDRCKHCH